MLDEPVASLDPVARREFLLDLMEIVAEYGTSVVLSSHPASWEVIEESHAGKQSTLLVRTSEPVLDPAWTVRPVSLEDMVLAYMSQLGNTARAERAGLEIAS